MSEHVWKDGFTSSECRKCGILRNWRVTIDCDEIVKINATHKWGLVGSSWFCSKCKCYGYGKGTVPIRNKYDADGNRVIVTCNEAMMERVLK